jgi:hypothetical protein
VTFRECSFLDERRPVVVPQKVESESRNASQTQPPRSARQRCLVPDKGAWCPTKVPGTRSRVARRQPGPLMDANGALIELTTTLKQGPPSQSCPPTTQSFLSTQSIQSKNPRADQRGAGPQSGCSVCRLDNSFHFKNQQSSLDNHQSIARKTRGQSPGIQAPMAASDGGFASFERR